MILFPLKRILYRNIMRVSVRGGFTESDVVQKRYWMREMPVKGNCFLYFILGIT